jgi:hypothetical protein
MQNRSQADSGSATERAHARLTEIVNRGSGALVAALQATLIEAELATDVVAAARRLRMAASGEIRARAMVALFDAVDAFDDFRRRR